MLDDKIKDYAHKAIAIGVKTAEFLYVALIPSGYVYYFYKEGLLEGENQINRQNQLLALEFARVVAYGLLYIADK